VRCLQYRDSTCRNTHELLPHPDLDAWINTRHRRVLLERRLALYRAKFRGHRFVLRLGTVRKRRRLAMRKNSSQVRGHGNPAWNSALVRSRSGIQIHESAVYQHRRRSVRSICRRSWCAVAPFSRSVYAGRISLVYRSGSELPETRYLVQYARSPI